MLETSTADKANETSICFVNTISTSAHAEEVADSAKARAAVAVAEAKTARDIAQAAPNSDDIFFELDFPPFDMEDIFGDSHDNATLLGYLLGESDKALETMANFEEGLRSSRRESTETASGVPARAAPAIEMTLLPALLRFIVVVTVTVRASGAAAALPLTAWVGSGAAEKAVPAMAARVKKVAVCMIDIRAGINCESRR
ncbi:hypothetical protein GGI17_002985 [Coemansia sp. S146]|nr:hypothetical protein GGI17_002985 [Coemansia sp. S146]